MDDRIIAFRYSLYAAEELQVQKKGYSRYRKLYWRYVVCEKDYDVWEITDSAFECGNLARYNADIYRIDECIVLFIKQLREGRQHLSNYLRKNPLTTEECFRSPDPYQWTKQELLDLFNN